MRRLDDERIALAAQKNSVPLKIFLAGPFIDPRKQEEPTGGECSAGAKLRLSIFRKLEAMKIVCVLGEHQELQSIYKEHYGSQSNVTLAEITHVSDHSDGVIIIPDSPGSFSELGHFAAVQKVSSKMLVLMDETYKGQPSYIELGPSKLAEMLGAKVIYVPYDDPEFVFREAENFIERIKVHKMAKRYIVT